MFHRKDYTFSLPEELIAEEAVHPAHDARLLCLERDSGKILSETRFWELDTVVGSDRVLFFNNSKVVRARIPLKGNTFEKINGDQGIIQNGEIFFLTKHDDTRFEALIRPGKSFQIGTNIVVGKYTFRVEAHTAVGRILHVSGGTIESCMEEYGELPLPPYIEYQKEKEKDYQTVFAEKSGSVAAPTASLHFTKELLEKISIPSYTLTLHVGLGTFKPIDTDDIREYAIHSERAEVPFSIFEDIATLKQSGKKIIAVGTTVCRTLESLPAVWKTLTSAAKSDYKQSTRDFWDTIIQDSMIQDCIRDVNIRKGAIFFSTNIYITPGFLFHVVDDLITNFHLPESSLLVLVSAFLGKGNTDRAYHHAIKEKYRFYSFGDGMYIRGK